METQPKFNINITQHDLVDQMLVQDIKSVGQSLVTQILILPVLIL